LCQPLGIGEQLFSGRQPVPLSAQIGGPGLRSGDVVSAVSPPRPTLGCGSSALRVEVVGGPDAGQVRPLDAGAVVIGRAAGCDLRLSDPAVSRRHARVSVTAGRVVAHDLGSTHGVVIDGVPVGECGELLGPGQVLRVGDSFVALGDEPGPAAAARACPDGVVLVNPASRSASRLRANHGVDRPVIEVPDPSTPSTPPRRSWLSALLPAGAGAILAWALHAPAFALLALVAPFALLADALGDRRRTRRRDRAAAADHRRRLAEVDHEIATALAAERARRRADHPHPAQLLEIARTPEARLWERRRDDPDLLAVRVGLADCPSRLQTRLGGAICPAGVVSAVPVAVDLADGPLGIAGPDAQARRLAWWAVAQLAVLVSPADLEISLLADGAAAEYWRWLRWLPHCRGRVAVSPDERSALAGELAELVADRRRRADRAGPGQSAGPSADSS
jgi:S-DNA-T family DNA segregation ATPase FtsK/SpoIIIE